MSTLSTGRGAHAGQAPLLNPETIEVTPAGHDLEHWAHARAQAERLDLAGVLDRLGVAHLTDVPLEVLAAHPDDETLGLVSSRRRWWLPWPRCVRWRARPGWPSPRPRSRAGRPRPLRGPAQLRR
jgi:hypothetical protein